MKLRLQRLVLMYFFIVISLGIFRCRNYLLFFSTDQSSDTYVYICVLTSAFYSNSETSTIVNWFCTLCWKSDFTAWWHETNFTGVSITSPTSLSATVCVSQMTSGFCFSLSFEKSRLPSALVIIIGVYYDGQIALSLLAAVAGYLVAFWWRKCGQTGRWFVNSVKFLQSIFTTTKAFKLLMEVKNM